MNAYICLQDTTTLLDKTSMSVSSNIKAFLQPFWRYVGEMLNTVYDFLYLCRPLGLYVFSILNYGILQTSVVGNSTQHMVRDHP